MVRLKELFESKMKESKTPHTRPIPFKEKIKQIDERGGLEYIKAQAEAKQTMRITAKSLGVRVDDLRAYLKRHNTTYSELKNNRVYESGNSKITKNGGIEWLRTYAQKGYTQGQVANILGLKRGNVISNYVHREGFTWKELQEDVCE